MKVILNLVLFLLVLTTYAQDVKKEERILYVIDSIPIIDDPDESRGSLKNEDIDNLNVITDKQKLNALGYPSLDKIIFVTTKAYIKRPEESRRVPSTNSMERKNGIWYLKNSSEPYSGKFIDYYLNGKIQGDGIFKNGVVDGLRTLYYANGNKNYFRNYVNGIAEGCSEEYFQNGNIKQRGTFKQGKDEGLWEEFYSTGTVKRQTLFVNLKAQLSKDEEKFFSLQSKALELMGEEDFSSAIKKLDQAEKLNSNYTDIYFYRGTAKMNLFDFDGAVTDFDKAIKLEPLYMEALANRAFARLRKHEFKNSRTISKTKEITILAAKDKVDIPLDEQVKICEDLNKSVELGDNKPMILDAIKNYCL